MILALFKFAVRCTLLCSDKWDKDSEKCIENDMEGSNHG
jgi:hypothetical protein